MLFNKKLIKIGLRLAGTLNYSLFTENYCETLRELLNFG
jgi:hypothetical protein